MCEALAAAGGAGGHFATFFNGHAELSILTSEKELSLRFFCQKEFAPESSGAQAAAAFGGLAAPSAALERCLQRSQGPWGFGVGVAHEVL